MAATLPKLHFRLRENGATIYRVDSTNRERRLDLIEIAVLNLRNGALKPHGDAVLGADEAAEIAAWAEARRGHLAQQDALAAERCLEQLGQTAQWAQSRATPEALEAASDRLLLAMHDLRGVLLRKAAERLGKPEG